MILNMFVSIYTLVNVYLDSKSSISFFSFEVCKKHKCVRAAE